MSASLPVDPIHAALHRLGVAVAEFAQKWDDESLIVRVEARRAVREAALQLALACADDDDGVPLA